MSHASLSPPHKVLTALLEAAVDGGNPFLGIENHLPQKPKGRTVVVGAGKAVGRMAEAFESLWKGSFGGVVVGRHGSTSSVSKIRFMTASHLVPDEAGLLAS